MPLLSVVLSSTPSPLRCRFTGRSATVAAASCGSMYVSMNDDSVTSTCRQSDDMYDWPTSTGTVRSPATRLRYAMFAQLRSRCIAGQQSISPVIIMGVLDKRRRHNTVIRQRQWPSSYKRITGPVKDESKMRRGDVNYTEDSGNARGTRVARHFGT